MLQAALSTIELRRVFRAPRERVFRAWAEPEALKKWWCPNGWAPLAVAVNLRVGGAFHIGMLNLGTGVEVAVCGQFLEICPPERLQFTWRWIGAFAALPETLVTLDFVEFAGGTELILRHERFADAGTRQQHRTGWMFACGRLDRSLTAL